MNCEKRSNNEAASQKAIKRFVAFVAVILSVGITTSHAQSTLDSWNESVIKNAVNKISDSVVQIETIGGLDRAAGTEISTGPSTGTIVGKEGYVVTSSLNLIQQPSAIFVKLAGGERFAAQIVSRNESRKIVLLKIDTDRQLPVPDFLKRSQMEVGQSVIAVGKVFDVDSANLSTGILSATNRIWGRAIQTDAKISPNNFGGPLINLEGNLLGILVPLSPSSTEVSGGTEWYDSGVGFAVPLNELHLAKMTDGADLRPGLLGVSFKEDNGYASQAVVAACPAGSPAARAGIKPGDKIIEINGQPIRLVNHARHALGALYENDEVKLVLERDGGKLNGTATLVGEIRPFRFPMLGILPGPDDDDSGILVQHVITGSGAENAGIQPGDRIKSIQQTEVVDQDSLAAELIKYAIDESVSINFNRDQIDQTANVTLSELHGRPVFLDPTPAPAENREGALELAEIKIPEHPNKCFAYIPESISSGRSRTRAEFGILVWLSAPGEIDAKAIVRKWKPYCDARGIVIVLPQSRDNKQWLPIELEYLAGVVQQVSAEYDVNPRKVCVGGNESGGTMASIFAMTHRPLIRGLVVKDSPISARIGKTKTDAANRLLVLLVNSQADNKTTQQITESKQLLDQNGFPVELINFDSSNPQQLIIDWINTIDRL